MKMPTQRNGPPGPESMSGASGFSGAGFLDDLSGPVRARTTPGSVLMVLREEARLAGVSR